METVNPVPDNTAPKTPVWKNRTAQIVVGTAAVSVAALALFRKFDLNGVDPGPVPVETPAVI